MVSFGGQYRSAVNCRFGRGWKVRNVDGKDGYLVPILLPYVKNEGVFRCPNGPTNFLGAEGLQALGVKYVLVRRELKAAGLPNTGRPGRALRFLTEDTYIALYLLRKRGPNVLVTPG